jgi:hypothetical protein
MFTYFNFHRYGSQSCYVEVAASEFICCRTICFLGAILKKRNLDTHHPAPFPATERDKTIEMSRLLRRLTSLRSSLSLSTLSPLDLVGRYLAWTVWLVSRARLTKNTKQAVKKNFLANILATSMVVRTGD